MTVTPKPTSKKQKGKRKAHPGGPSKPEKRTKPSSPTLLAPSLPSQPQSPSGQLTLSSNMHPSRLTAFAGARDTKMHPGFGVVHAPPGTFEQASVPGPSTAVDMPSWWNPLRVTNRHLTPVTSSQPWPTFENATCKGGILIEDPRPPNEPDHSATQPGPANHHTEKTRDGHQDAANLSKASQKMTRRAVTLQRLIGENQRELARLNKVLVTNHPDAIDKTPTKSITGPQTPSDEANQVTTQSKENSVDESKKAAQELQAENVRLRKQVIDQKNELHVAKTALLESQAQLEILQKAATVSDLARLRIDTDQIELLQAETEMLKAKEKWWIAEKSLLQARLNIAEKKHVKEGGHK